MNKLTAIVVGCLFLQLTSGASFPFSRSETTRDVWDDLLYNLEQHGPKGKVTTSAGEQLAVSTSVRYSTIQTVDLDQDEQTWFVGELCGQSVGKALNVTMFLNNNPGWEPVKGVVEYIVVDSQAGGGEVLCSNKDSNGYATPYCLVESWPTKYDLIVIVRAGPVSGIAFSMDAEFYDAGSEAALQIKLNKLNYPIPSLEGIDTQSLPPAPIPLTQSVSAFPAVTLSYLQEAILKFSWCSNSQTKVFQILSTVTSSDGKSSYTQYICDQLPCDVGLNNIAHNGNQLSSNSVVTGPMVYKQVYIVIVNWAGVFDPIAQTYTGNFLYNANQVELV